MLTPDYLKKAPDYIVKLYQELEDFIIEDISRRIAKAGKITSTAEWQYIKAQEIGLSEREIKKKIKEMLKKSDKEIDKLFKEAAEESIKFDNKIYEKANLKTISLDGSKMLQDYVKAFKKQTKGELKNITNSLGFCTKEVNEKIKSRLLTQAYIKHMDFAQLQISSGAIDYNTAIRNTVKELSKSGVQFINYDSGWHNRLDVAVRRSTLTGLNQMSQKMTEGLMEEMNCEYVEVSAHPGARPTHEEWQGGVYQMNGSSSEYPNFEDTTGYGSADGLGGYGCRHSFFPFFPGISTRTYSKEDLKNINPYENIDYNGKTYTYYEATQKQRQLERDIRASKRELVGYKAIGDNQAFANASIKLQQQKEAYNSFNKAVNLKANNARTQANGFGRSISQKSVNNYKSVEKEANRLYNLGSSKDNIKAYLRDKPTRDILEKRNIQFVQRINEKEVIVKLDKPNITGVREHIYDNMKVKEDRKNMTPSKGQEFVDNAKLVLYQELNETIKFLADKGYTVLNLDYELVTIVPQKWRNKYNKYI
ncbi:phage minor capsid protein [Terrisporobacter glycolicus]|uniref:Phage minor capsid protein 2 n=1 Tax=Terrisporobacter glycolicus ATCC 14880 = DSM 1288 TaxID=1121315 RepID=A0ABZ2EWR4_9FIRM|nr:phage minor capsid protein [Terrisporobacter glycolicus]